MLCQLAFFEPEKLKLLVKGNVRNECNGYAITVSRSVQRVCSDTLTHTFEDTCVYRRRQTFYLFTNRGFSGPKESGQVEMEAYVFCCVVN